MRAAARADDADSAKVAGGNAEEADLRLRRGVAAARQRRDRHSSSKRRGGIQCRRCRRSEPARGRARRLAQRRRSSASPSATVRPRIGTRTAGMKPRSQDRQAHVPQERRDRRRPARGRGRRARRLRRIQRRGADAAEREHRRPAGAARRTDDRASERRPNILVIMVDQLRFPQWFWPAPGRGVGLPPNLAAPARRGGLLRPPLHRLERLHARALGAADRPLHPPDRLHDHRRQHARSRAFPTWGTMLREHGYHTCWYGKWHLTHHDNKWTPATGRPRSSATASRAAPTPRPTAAPARAGAWTRSIARQFEDWFAHEGGSEPWCTTVSFVNPHDIAWWYRWSDRVPAEAQRAAASIGRLPPNFETPELLIERNKPRLQRSLPGHRRRLVRAGARSPARKRRQMAGVPRPLREAPARGRPPHRPRPAARSQSRPEVAANTVIVFTSDHGEYGASHGLRGKGAGAYEEGDPRAADRQGPPRRADQRTRTRPRRSSPRASTSRRCC